MPEMQEMTSSSTRRRWTWTTTLTSLMIALSTSYQYGYNLSVLNQPMLLVKEFLNESYSPVTTPPLTTSTSTSLPEASTPTSPAPSSSTSLPAQNSICENTLTILWSLCTAVFVCGGMIGSFVVGWLADRLGRKYTLMLNAGPSIVGGLLSGSCVWAGSPVLLLIGRFVTGLSCGAATQLGPMYMIEIVPFDFKGAMGALYGLFVSIGVLMGTFFGLNIILGVEDKWPILLLLNVVPGLASLFVFPLLPDSPRYLLVTKKNKKSAEKALKWLRQSEDVSKEIKEMEEESKNQGDDETFSMLKLLRTRELLAPLIVCLLLQIVQQFSGINAITFYSKSILLKAGVSVDVVQYAILGIFLISVATNILTVPLMDRLGRRMMLLAPMSGMILVLIVISVSLNLQPLYPPINYLTIVCLVLYVVLFASGLGPVPNMITAEVFRQGPRSKAMSLAGLLNWLSNTIVAMSFEIVQAATREFIFLIFLVIMIASVIFIYFKVPETKNKSFDEIASQFKSTHRRSNDQMTAVVV
ncbi:hypothetical protein HELRODRAFT_114208 [Helobdella robusta]|uniref:Major facilitator superfamily (MFS) profile domain-containing protein n=1 Tax=Helobdella robusta TaxID=6412 RepID=T1EG01_HELRO|nr:hypothetical protein HELRODRAFT_114208 [Helobdella robusta]ESN97610.1 hypothetical protein HELRODRAFT_114208 [Helobdella robusta]